MTIGYHCVSAQCSKFEAKQRTVVINRNYDAHYTESSTGEKSVKLASTLP